MKPAKKYQIEKRKTQAKEMALERRVVRAGLARNRRGQTETYCSDGMKNMNPNDSGKCSPEGNQKQTPRQIKILNRSKTVLLLHQTSQQIAKH